MQVAAASSAFAGLVRAQLALDAAASSVSRASAIAPVPEAPAVAGLGSSERFDDPSMGGDEIAPFVQLVAAQRAFGASLAVMRSDAEVQRTIIDMVR